MPFKSQVRPSIARLSTAGADKAAPAKTLSIPEAGHLYFGLSKNGAYDAAARARFRTFRSAG